MIEDVVVHNGLLGIAARTFVWMVASLDRKRLGVDLRGAEKCTAEAFSIRRLEGSRWRLRRTLAMGNEYRF
jgi:hypothetical protein